MPPMFALLYLTLFAANVTAGSAGVTPIPEAPGRDRGGNQARRGRRAGSGDRRALKSLGEGIPVCRGDKLLG
jgi:hypothetical protein